MVNVRCQRGGPSPLGGGTVAPKLECLRYGLNDRWTMSSKGTVFPLVCNIQTGFGAYEATCPMGHAVFTWGKTAGTRIWPLSIRGCCCVQLHPWVLYPVSWSLRQWKMFLPLHHRIDTLGSRTRSYMHLEALSCVLHTAPIFPSTL